MPEELQESRKLLPIEESGASEYEGVRLNPDALVEHPLDCDISRVSDPPATKSSIADAHAPAQRAHLGNWNGRGLRINSSSAG